MIVKLADQGAAFGGVPTKGSVVGAPAADAQDQQRGVVRGRRVHLQRGLRSAGLGAWPDATSSSTGPATRRAFSRWRCRRG